MAEKWSPLWWESLIARKLEAWLLPPERRRGGVIASFWPWLLGSALIAVWFWLPPWREPSLLNFGGNVNIVAFAIGLALLIGKFRECEWSAEAREWWSVGSSLLAYAAIIVSFNSLPAARASRLLIEFLVPLAFFIWPASSRGYRGKLVFGFIMLFAVPLASGFTTYQHYGYGGFRPVEIRFLIPVMLPLLAWLAVSQTKSLRDWSAVWAIWLSPAQWISKTALLPDFIRSAPGQRSRTLGMFWILIGAFHLGVTVLFFSDFSGIESRAPENLADFLFLGGLSYLRFYFHVYGASALARGIFYLSGWETPAFFNFAPLAVSPQDRWRRWDIPVYMTYRLFVFIPVLRKTGSLFLGIFLTFFTVSLSYTFQALFYFSGPQGEQSYYTIGKILVFYLMQATFVYLGVLLQRFWPEAEKRTGWFGVLITTFMMSLCYGLRHLPYGWFEGL